MKYYKIWMMCLIVVGLSYFNSFAQLPKRNGFFPRAEKPVLNYEVMQKIIISIPSPLENTNLGNKQGLKFSNELLPLSFKKQQTNIHKQAWFVGTYYTNLMQAIIYKQQHHYNNYLANIQRLTKKMSVDQIMDNPNLNASITSKARQRRLLNEMGLVYENIIDHWVKIWYADLSIAMITGSFVENLYWLTSKAPLNDSIIWQRVGEEKITLEQIMLLLYTYRAMPYIKSLMLKMRKLERIFDSIRLEYQYKEPSFKARRDLLLINGHATTKANLTKALKQKLKDQIKWVRFQMLHGK